MSDHYEMQISDLKERIAELKKEVERLQGKLVESLTCNHIFEYPNGYTQGAVDSDSGICTKCNVKL